MENSYDIIIIGGGQSGLTCGYHLRRSNFSFLILDKQEKPGGAWNNAWDSLTLFSPAEHSSLAGWQMPKSENLFPSKDEVISYLHQYEEHYQLPIKRNAEVLSITNENKFFSLKTTQGDFYSKVVIGATGTWNNPFIPNIEGKELYKGIQIHSAHYKNAKLSLKENILSGLNPWKLNWAVGGGPVLVKDGAIFISNNEEKKFAGKAIADHHPRTAMGYTKDGQLILLAVQGRMKNIAVGTTLTETAQILIDLGAVEAINLDGGGSSCLLVNGKETIKPSDPTGQRPVPAVFFVK